MCKLFDLHRAETLYTEFKAHKATEHDSAATRYTYAIEQRGAEARIRAIQCTRCAWETLAKL